MQEKFEALKEKAAKESAEAKSLISLGELRAKFYR